MPTPSITLHRLVNRNPAVYEASYGDKRVEVRLDMSVILMLERQRNYQDLIVS
jgi:hypothetical protein